MKIKNIKAYEILDSRGNPTVEAEVILESGAKGTAAVPSGASTGMHEAAELRDGDMSRYGGKGVLKAVQNIKDEIRDCLVGRNALNQAKIDAQLCKLDGTKNKSRLGANATLAVSMAAARAAADYLKIPLYRYIGGINAAQMPLPMMNILNGGAHAGNNLDIQEFMIVPVGAKTFAQGVRMCCEVYSELKNHLKNAGLSVSVGDEGGFAPDLKNEEEAIEFILKAAESAGYTSAEIKIALDVASSEWYVNGVYRLPKQGRVMNGDELCAYITRLCAKYPIISVEDGAAEDDFETWDKLTEALGDKVILVGDDLFVTNTARIQRGIDMKIANSVLIKPNQIGTVTQTLEAIRLAKQNGYGTVISHRSGETADTFIADLAVGTNAGLIKTGAPARGERTSKYNALMKIEKDI